MRTAWIKTFCISTLLVPLAISAAKAAAQTILETTVVTGKRFPETLNQVAGSISKIETDTVETIAAKHFNEITGSAPGTWISRGSGQEHLSAIRSPVFTGAGACAAFLMAEDDIPLRASGFCNVNELFDTHYEVAQSVEVFRGPNSSTFGSNALYGGINVKLPEPGEQVSESIQMDVDQFQYARLSLQHSDDAWWLGATFTDDEGYREDAGFRQQKVSYKYAWHGKDLQITNSFTLNELEQDTAGYIEGQDAYKDENRIRQNDNPEAWRDASSLRAYSKWQWQNNNGEFSFTPWLRKNDMRFLMHFVPWQPLEENAHQSLGASFLWRTHTKENVSGFAGLEFEYTDAELFEYQHNPAPFSPDTFPVGVHYDYEVAAVTAAVFAGVSWQMSERLKLEWQSRADDIRYDYNNLAPDGSACAPGIDNCRFYRPADRENNFGFLSSKLSSLFSLNEKHLLYVNIARAFRVPQASELYRLQQGQQIADLDEVKLDSLELGARGTFFVETLASLDYDLAVFTMKKTDGIFQDSQRQYVSGSDTDHEGFEYSLRWQLLDNLALRLAGTYAQHRYSNSPNFLETSMPLKDKEIDTAPKNLHSLELQWQASTQFAANFKLQQMGAYFTNPENTHRYEGHTLANLRLRYQFNEQLNTTLGIDNLFDERYAERADIAFGTPRYFPGQERTISLSLRWRAQ